tara:strand:+ start:53227 stop:54453 length:1227 start_codon:yes stop_codon:yes gene_type:complete
MNGTHVYTSITANYLPKVRVLAESVKRIAPHIRFHVVLSDNTPAGFDLDSEPFDELIFSEQLIKEGFARWAFGHSVVELCTAVKGPALEYLFEVCQAEKVFYFDPDMVVFSRLDELEEVLAQSSVLLTPHLTDPDTTDMAILDNELSSLRHGVFNLGFIGVRNVPEGRRFASWWSQRLEKYCHDDLPRGLFTDQKWVDLAPCFFDGVKILRSPAFNVATWNIANRKATGSLEEGIFVNGEPLGFYHFSGFDSGDQITMLSRYGADSPVLYALRDWYIAECERHGQSRLGATPAKYEFFSNGERIERGYRLLYRRRTDLQSAFPNPFLVAGLDSYKAWYDAHPAEQVPTGAVVIQPGVPVYTVLADLARDLNQRLVAGPARGIVKRCMIKAGIASLRLASRAAAMAGGR